MTRCKFSNFASVVATSFVVSQVGAVRDANKKRNQSNVSWVRPSMWPSTWAGGPWTLIETFGNASRFVTDHAQEMSANRVGWRSLNSSDAGGLSAMKTQLMRSKGPMSQQPVVRTTCHGDIGCNLSARELGGFWAMALCIFAIFGMLGVQLGKMLIYFAYADLQANPNVNIDLLVHGHSDLDHVDEDIDREDEDVADAAVNDCAVNDCDDENINDALEFNGWDIRFKNCSYEAKWRQVEYNDKIKSGAWVIIFWTAVCSMYQGLDILLDYIKGHEITSNVACLVVCVAMAIPARWCYTNPTHWLFIGMVHYFFFMVGATQLPPFTASCWQIVTLRDKKCSTTGVQAFFCDSSDVRHMDCHLEGHSSMQIIMTWILMLPWVMPRLVHMHLTWLWILGVLPAWATLHQYMTSCAVFQPQDSLFRLLILSLTLCFAIHQKYRLESGRRTQFLQNLQQKAASKKIYSILAFMMPKHVIVPLLNQDQMPDGGKSEIVDAVPRVSILFVLIADFDTFTHRMTPSELLDFLNHQFTQMDDICIQHKVTKIETVCEEYVACVGVLPEHKVENDQVGHSPLLMRLIEAAEQILLIQTVEVRFKMGIQTGPIRAGVIGTTKLPRYRLFGDTINSAARMMQKGEPGKLQFGVDTYKDLPEEMRSLVKDRGDVEMKGKGKVRAYTFEPRPSMKPPVPALERTSPGRASVVKSAAGIQKDKNLENDFEEALQELHFSRAMSQEPQHYIITEKNWFTPQMEKDWFQWYNEETLCHNIARRLGVHALVLICVSGLELRVFEQDEPNELWGVNYKDEPRRITQFMFCRGFVVLGHVILWLLAETSTTGRALSGTRKSHDQEKSFLERNPTTTQVILMLKCGVDIILLYLSYESLFITNNKNFVRRMHFAQKFRVPMDQLLTLNFVLFVFLWVRPHAFLFSTQFILMPLTIAVVSSPDLYHGIRQVFPSRLPDPWAQWDSMYSLRGDLFFSIMVLLHVIVGHTEEQASRQEYRTMKAVQNTATRTKGILDTLMPPLVLEKLLKNPKQSDHYRHATITQSDLCGFTKLASTATPKEVVKFMSQLFGKFDDLADKHGVYKVETIGDAYVAGVAEPPLTEENSPINVVFFGLDMVRAVDIWSEAMKSEVTCRVGIHYGECIGGVVGTDMQRYHLFGDLLVGLEILESTAPEGRVQVSKACMQEVERQRKGLKEQESKKQVKKKVVIHEELTFAQRQDGELKTSKGETHTFDSVGGPTYLVESDQPLRKRSNLQTLLQS